REDEEAAGRRCPGRRHQRRRRVSGHTRRDRSERRDNTDRERDAGASHELVIGLPMLVGAMLAALPQPDSMDISLFLIGDAGVPRVGFEPVLAALQREAAQTNGKGVIVFLGDNIYPRGLPDSAYLADRIESERRITAQVAAAESSHVTTIFIP